MKRIKFAILGMGRIGKVHADTIQANSNAELAAIHDPINNEINSVSDNPIVLGGSKIGYSGHFHAEHIAIALDSIAIAMSEIGAISERRIHYFMKGAEGRLPLFLAKTLVLNLDI